MNPQKEITLAQWCAYLPYGVEVFLQADGPIQGNYLLKANNFSTVAYSGAWKLLLRPMSKENEANIDSLLVDIDNKDWFYYGDGKFSSSNIEGMVSIQEVPYNLVQNLLSNHYDIFGLIEKGLALAI